MSQVKLTGIVKEYGDNARIIHGIDLDIADGEFVVFVGPSGCGKSTLLRMIAGLEDITAGELHIGDTLANDVAPAKRGMKGAQMGIIFERFAMPWGEEPASVMLTAIDDWTNNEKLKANDEGKVKGDRNGGKASENVQRGGEIGAAGAGAVILGGAAAGAGPGVYAAGAGAIGGGLLAGLLLTKGKEVRLQPGAVFRIKFTKPVTLPVIATPGTTPKPIIQDAPVSTESTAASPA